MANITYPPSRPLTVGEVLDLSFRIFGATVVKCLPFAAIAVIASQAPNIYSLAHGRTITQALLSQTHDPMFWALYVLGALLAAILYATILLRQHALITGQPTGSEFGQAARRLPGMVLLGIVFTLILALPFVLMGAGVAAGTGVLLFGLILLIPAAYLGVQLSCAWAALLLSGSGAFQALARSWRLTAGSFWRLTVIYTVAIIIIIVAYLLLTLIAGAVAAVFGRGDVIVFMAAYTVVVVAMGALIAPFYTALTLSVFGDLTVRKEGADLAQRISAPT